MNPADANDRLSQIATQWTLLFAAHAGTAAGGGMLRAELVQRYCDAVYRYLLAAVRDPDVAADLAQDFAVRFLRGDFRQAHPDRGRFRSYLKTVLFNLVADFHRSRKPAERALNVDVCDPAAAQVAEDDEDAQFLRSWRETVLERTWRALCRYNATYHAALQLRVGDAEMTSGRMAELLTSQLGRAINAAAARKAVQRGHEKFADLLLEEVAQTLANPDPAEIEGELRELDLLRYCQSALQRRRERSG